MAHKESNIPQNVFHSESKLSFSELLIQLYASGTLFIPKAKEFLGRIEQQGSKGDATATSLRKIILAHTESFKHFSILSQEFLNIFLEDKL